MGTQKMRALIKTLRTDPVYRHRVVHTAVVVWSFVGLGWMVGISGPSFPDLRMIIGDEDIAASSWLFTIGASGYLAGSLVSGILYDKYNKLLLLAVSTIGMGVASIMIPYCTSLATMMLTRCIGGFFCGGLDTGGNADILYVWGSQSGPYMQAIHFGFSLGALLAPLATEPFLAKKIIECQNLTRENYTEHPPYMNGTNDTYTFSESIVTPTVTAIDPKQSNVSLTTLQSTSEEGSTMKFETTLCRSVNEDTNVHSAYLLLSLIIFSSTLGFLYVYLRLRLSKTTSKHEVKNASKSDREDDSAKRPELPLKLKVLFLVLLANLISAYCVVEDAFSMYLMTFGLEYLQWDKSTGARASAVFWICFGIGRFLGIFTVSCCDSTRMLTIYMLLLAVGISGFLFSSLFLLYGLLWPFICLLGVSMSVIFPAIFSFTSDNIISVNGKISSIFLTSASFTAMIYPLLIGNLMQHYHPMWFVYILFIFAGVDFVVFFILIKLLLKCLPDSAAFRKQKELYVKEATEMELLN